MKNFNSVTLCQDKTCITATGDLANLVIGVLIVALIVKLAVR